MRKRKETVPAAERPSRSKYARKAKTPRPSQVRHPRLTDVVTVEMRTGSGVVCRTTVRSKAFVHVPGALGDGCACCHPGVMRKLECFYSRIDRELARWEYERDLALRVPYAVRRERARRAFERLNRKLVTKNAAGRGRK